MNGGNTQPMIIEYEPYDSFYWNKSAEFQRPPLKNVAKTVTTDSHAPAVVVPVVDTYMKESENKPQIIQAGTIAYPDHSGEHQQDFVQHADGISRAILAGTHASTPHLLKTYIPMAEQKQIELPAELKGKKFRIRKLTPREVLRLMDVDDNDIDKFFEAGLSNSAIYKLAGNSIVVSVLYHLFRKLFIETEPDNDGTPTQLTLF